MSKLTNTLEILKAIERHLDQVKKQEDLSQEQIANINATFSVMLLGDVATSLAEIADALNKREADK